MTKIILIILLVVIALAAAIMAYVNREYEQPAYTVQQQEGAVELRLYDPYITAQVTLPGTMDETMNDAFRILADYIFGNNISMTAPVTGTEGQKLNMTAPVTGTAAGSSFTTAFVMPGAYTLQSLPKPKDDRVQLRAVPQRRVLAVRFSGFMRKEKQDAAMQQITAFAKQRGLVLAGAPQVAFYQNPYTTLPWQRRNEVLVEVAD